jgi:hypothetical protein
LSHLLEHDSQKLGQQLLRWLCLDDGLTDPDLDSATPVIKTQFNTELGRPDVHVVWKDLFILIEVKLTHRLPDKQRIAYAEILRRSRSTSKGIVLLSLTPVVFDSTPEYFAKHVSWHEVAQWMRCHVPGDEVGGFLVRQFIAFLEECHMAVQHVDQTYSDGLQQFFRLIVMLERAIRDVRPPLAIYQDKPSGGKKFWLFRFGEPADDCRFQALIYFDQPQVIRFKIANSLPSALTASLPPGWDKKKKWWGRDFQLDDRFFGLTSDLQLANLTRFLGESVETASALLER